MKYRHKPSKSIFGTLLIEANNMTRKNKNAETQTPETPETPELTTVIDPVDPVDPVGPVGPDQVVTETRKESTTPDTIVPTSVSLEEITPKKRRKRRTKEEISGVKPVAAKVEPSTTTVVAIPTMALISLIEVVGSVVSGGTTPTINAIERGLIESSLEETLKSLPTDVSGKVGLYMYPAMLVAGIGMYTIRAISARTNKPKTVKEGETPEATPATYNSVDIISTSELPKNDFFAGNRGI